MKKVLTKIISFILILIFFSSNNFVFSNSECKIKSTPEYMIKYIKNIRKIISNVNKTAITKKKDEIKKREEEKSFFGRSNSNNMDKTSKTL
jgi:hypothetical protein